MAVPKPEQRRAVTDGGLLMKQAMTRELFAYWDEIRGDRLAPERADIDPAGIRGLLGHAFVLEVDSAGRFPFRLSGSRINALFLRELRGSSFIDLWRISEHAEIAKLLFSVLDDTAPTVVGTSAAPAGHLAIDLELLLLPLRHHGKTHARLLGSLAPAVQSSWFGLIAAEPLDCTRYASCAPARPPADDGCHRCHARTNSAGRPPKPRAEPAITRRDHLTVYSSRS